jgi:putative ABC transport system ATP-binding protein
VEPREHPIVITIVPPAANVTDVTRRFRGANDVVTALDRVSAVIPAAQLTVVAGPSGSGKSTLLTLFGGIQRP